MDPRLLHMATAFGLSASVGLNTTLPLLLIGIAHDAGLLHLASPYDALGGPIILSILGVLALIELLGDKVPGLDSLIHALQTPLSLGAGALLAGSQAQAISAVHPELVIAMGLAAAGGTHLARTSLRPIVHLASLGALGTPMSIIEDVVSVSLVAISLLTPYLVPPALLCLLAGWLLIMGLAVRGMVRMGRLVTRAIGGAARQMAGQVVSSLSYRYPAINRRLLPTATPHTSPLALAPGETGKPASTEADIWDI